MGIASAYYDEHAGVNFVALPGIAAHLFDGCSGRSILGGMWALSTGSLPAIDPPERPGRLMGLGFEGLALGPEEAARDALTGALAGGRFPIMAVVAPTAPRLSSTDRHEQRAAAARAGQELDRANHLECPHLLLNLGALDTSVLNGPADRWRTLIDAFARGGGIDGQRRELLRVRLEVRDRHLDSVRRALDVLLPLAQRRGASLGLLPAENGWSLGLREEIRVLCDDFAGGPLAFWHATDREHHLAALGLLDDRPMTAIGAQVADAAGLTGGLPPGSAEVDFAAALAGLPEGAPLVVATAHATETELRRALGVLRTVRGGGGD